MSSASVPSHSLFPHSLFWWEYFPRTSDFRYCPFIMWHFLLDMKFKMLLHKLGKIHIYIHFICFTYIHKLWSVTIYGRPLFASSLLSIIHILLDQTRHDEIRILGCQALFDFVNNQVSVVGRFFLFQVVACFFQEILNHNCLSISLQILRKSLNSWNNFDFVEGWYLYVQLRWLDSKTLFFSSRNGGGGEGTTFAFSWASGSFINGNLPTYQ